MNVEDLRAYCIKKPGVTESFPFDEHTLVFKVMNKMFAIVGLERQPLFVNLKCDPDYAIELREQYDGIILPGYHMNKKLWNSVYLERELSLDLYLSLIDHSYELIVKSLPKKKKEELAMLKDEA
jgi:predicted DNA-binding protein (MmcQ/YjbR family)